MSTLFRYHLILGNSKVGVPKHNRKTRLNPLNTDTQGAVHDVRRLEDRDQRFKTRSLVHKLKGTSRVSCLVKTRLSLTNHLSQLKMMYFVITSQYMNTSVSLHRIRFTAQLGVSYNFPFGLKQSLFDLIIIYYNTRCNTKGGGSISIQL